VVKACNMDFDWVEEKRKLQLQQLEELRLEAYKNSKFYKEKTKQYHDKMIVQKEFLIGQKVLLFNSHLKLIPGKLHSRWIGPFIVTNVFTYGVVEIQSDSTNKSFKVNGHRSKHFHESPALEETIEEISLEKPTYPQFQIFSPWCGSFSFPTLYMHLFYFCHDLIMLYWGQCVI